MLRKPTKGQTNPLRRFGFITTNSITQAFSRRVIERHMTAKAPLSLVFAVPNHPWLKASDKAAVRIAMTVGEVGKRTGTLATVVSENEGDGGEFNIELSKRTGFIHSDLRIGPDISSLMPLRANDLISGTGLILGSRGFTLTQEEAGKYHAY